MRVQRCEQTLSLSSTLPAFDVTVLAMHSSRLASAFALSTSVTLKGVLAQSMRFRTSGGTEDICLRELATWARHCAVSCVNPQIPLFLRHNGGSKTPRCRGCPRRQPWGRRQPRPNCQHHCRPSRRRRVLRRSVIVPRSIREVPRCGIFFAKFRLRISRNTRNTSV